MKKQSSYKFIWYKNEKYGEPIVRETWVHTAGGRQVALNIFMHTCGNVKQNTITQAEEHNSSGVEVFTPEVIKQGGRYIAV